MTTYRNSYRAPHHRSRKPEANLYDVVIPTVVIILTIVIDLLVWYAVTF